MKTTAAEEAKNESSQVKFRLKFIITIFVAMLALLMIPMIVLVVTSSVMSQQLADEIATRVSELTFSRAHSYVSEIIRNTAASVQNTADNISDRCMLQNAHGEFQYDTDRKWALEHMYQVLYSDQSRFEYGLGLEESGHYCGVTPVLQDFEPMANETEPIDSNIMFHILERNKQNTSAIDGTGLYYYRTKLGNWRLFDYMSHSTFDIFVRPWYDVPKKRNELSITPTYLTATTSVITEPQVVIAIGTPIVNKRNSSSIIGVLYTEFNLRSLSPFVATLNTTANSFAFIAEMILNADNTTYTTNVFAYKDASAVTKEDRSFIPVQEIADPLLKKSLELIPITVVEMSEASRKVEFHFNDRAFIATYGSVNHNERDPTWVIGVIVPLEDIDGERARLYAVGSVFAGLLCFIFGMIIVVGVTRKTYKQTDLKRLVKMCTAQLEESLARSAELLKAAVAEEEKTQAILNWSPDAIVGTTATGEITVFNNAAEAMFKITRSDVVNSKINIRRLIPALSTIFSQSEHSQPSSSRSSSISSGNSNSSGSKPAVSPTDVDAASGIPLVDITNGNAAAMDSDSDMYSRVASVKAQSKFGEKFTVHMSYSRRELNGSIMYLFMLRDVNGERPNIRTLATKDLTEGNNILYDILRDPEQKEKFRKLCEQEFNVENLLFVENVALYKSMDDMRERAELADTIIADFLTQDGKYELNVPDRIFREVIAERDLYRKNLFDAAEAYVRSMLYDTIKSWQRRTRGYEELQK